MMMKALHPLLLLIGLSQCVVNVQGESSSYDVGLPRITFDLQSDTPSDLRDVMVEVLELTRTHLTKHFQDYFTAREHEDFFRHLDLSVKTWDVSGDRQRRLQNRVMQITYHGISFFGWDPRPEKELLRDLVIDSFQGDAGNEFVDSLVMSNEKFLSSLSYLVVSIDGDAIANTDLAHRASTEETSTSNTPYYLIGALIGAAVGLVIAAAILYYTFRLSKQKDENFIELAEPDGMIREKSDIDIEMKSTQSLSPEKSFISQESSKFTYNPKSISDLSTIPSQASGLQVDVTQILAVEAWQKNTISPITPAPFGADISAIDLDENKKDKHLSAVEECTKSQERSFSYSYDSKSASYLSKHSLLNLNRRTPRTSTTSNLYSLSNNDSQALSEISLHDDDGDVISDLKHLSVQINQRRATYR